MHENTINNEIYVVYADLFLALFTMAILMIGEPAGGAPESPLHLYVHGSGDIFSLNDPDEYITDQELSKRIESHPSRHVTLHVDPSLPIGLYGSLKRRLKNAGAVNIFYVEDKYDTTE